MKPTAKMSSPSSSPTQCEVSTSFVNASFIHYLSRSRFILAYKHSAVIYRTRRATLNLTWRGADWEDLANWRPLIWTLFAHATMGMWSRGILIEFSSIQPVLLFMMLRIRHSRSVRSICYLRSFVLCKQYSINNNNTYM